MSRFFVNALGTVLAVVLELSSVRAQTPADAARFQELQSQESKIREGYKVTAQQSAPLEEALARAPGDANARAKLLGFYFAPASQALGAPARIQARRNHILWLIRNRPESGLLMTSEASLDPAGHALADPQGYEQASKAWLEQTAKKDASALTLGNAGRFFYLHDKALATQFYARARKLEPANGMWPMMQGSVMASAVAGVTAMNQNGFPGPADAREAESDFAKSARRELQTTKDTVLMRAAADELLASGFMAQAMARQQTGKAPAVDALDLAEALLKRAQALDPVPETSASLARIYELRGMTATSDSQKKTQARARYEQMLKSTAALPANDPAHASEVLDLARAGVDAGDLDRAQSLAKSLLALVPRLKADPRFSSSVDEVVHHSHLILGRVALRKGDTKTAEANLLEAGRVGGGGTLSSFGPNMTLAKELLEKGNKEPVLQYLELCRKFWAFSKRMDPWIVEIRRGQVPNFGANLTY